MNSLSLQLVEPFLSKLPFLFKLLFSTSQALVFTFFKNRMIS